MSAEHHDVLVIGGGPAGQAAAIQAAHAGKSVLMIDRAPRPGGECVRRGTIPSKTLQQVAVDLRRLRRSGAEFIDSNVAPDASIERAMSRVGAIVDGHQATIAHRLEAEGVAFLRGLARFEEPGRLHVAFPGRESIEVSGDHVIIAVGSRPRCPEGIPIDHEHIFDSDSVLTMRYLPESLVVLGGGVIGAEYASIFASLGVSVHLVDRGPRPIGFLDRELSEIFLDAFREMGGTWHGDAAVARIAFDGFGAVETRLEDGRVLKTTKALVSLGRQADCEGLALERAGISLGARGLIAVDENFRAAESSIYAVGDVVGPPGLAASAMEQGRRAVRHALGLEAGPRSGLVPTGIYTIPEIAMVGIGESQAREAGRPITVGRAHFSELARGQIAGNTHGLLKLIADGEGRKVLGVEVVGDGATDLVHLGQAAIIAGWDVDEFVDNVFNFPTLGEAYRLAALQVVDRRREVPVGV